MGCYWFLFGLKLAVTKGEWGIFKDDRRIVPSPACELADQMGVAGILQVRRGMKKHKNIMLMSVLAALLMLLPACDTQNKEDDIEFVSLTATVVPQYDEYGEVIFVALVRVKTYAGANVIGKFSMNSLERPRTVPVSASAGQWLDIELSAADLAPIPGTYEVKVECTLSSTGKTVTGTTTLVVE